MSDLLYGEVEEELRSGIREVLGDRADWQHVLAWTERGESHDAGLWTVLGKELGVLLHLRVLIADESGRESAGAAEAGRLSARPCPMYECELPYTSPAAARGVPAEREAARPARRPKNVPSPIDVPLT